MTAKKAFDGDALDQRIYLLPGGAPKMAALMDAIAQADEAEDPFWQLNFRYQYACEATFRDDPPKAMPVAAQFAPIFEAHPDALPGDAGAEAYLMITQMGIDPIVRLPQIPMAQWERMMEQFLVLVKRYDVGLGVYWKQMSLFWQYIDVEKASAYFQKCLDVGRDALSDCEACDLSYTAKLALMRGDRVAAAEYIRPMESGKINLCSDVPQSYWLPYLEDALNRGDLAEAAPLAEKLYAKGDRDRRDLSYLGAVIRCWAYTDLDRAVEKAAQRLEWTIGMWDQKKVYDFYKGAWVCFRQLAKRQETAALALPKEFALYREDGVYNCAALAEWFHHQAEAIGRRFDKRNGSNYFAKDLALACMCEGRAGECGL